MGAGDMKKPSVVPAQATVDRIAGVIGGGGAYWRVTVRTAPWHFPARTAVYTIRAHNDTLAAHEGLRRFEEEAAKPKQPLVT